MVLFLGVLSLHQGGKQLILRYLNCSTQHFYIINNTILPFTGAYLCPTPLIHHFILKITRHSLDTLLSPH